MLVEKQADRLNLSGFERSLRIGHGALLNSIAARERRGQTPIIP